MKLIKFFLIALVILLTSCRELIQLPDYESFTHAEIIGHVRDDGFVEIVITKQVTLLKEGSKANPNCCYTMTANNIGIDCKGNKIKFY
jgi:hypothetical protein